MDLNQLKFFLLRVVKVSFSSVFCFFSLLICFVFLGTPSTTRLERTWSCKGKFLLNFFSFCPFFAFFRFFFIFFLCFLFCFFLIMIFDLLFFIFFFFFFFVLFSFLFFRF